MPPPITPEQLLDVWRYSLRTEAITIDQLRLILPADAFQRCMRP